MSQGRYPSNAFRPEPTPRIRVLGTDIDNLNVEDAAALLAARPAWASFAYVVTPNAQHFVLLDRERQAGQEAPFRAAYSGAWLSLCDGQSIRVLMRLLHGLRLPHAPGSDLTARLLKDVITADDPITVIGGDNALAERLRQRFRLTRLSLHSPPMGYIDDQQAVEDCVRFVREHPARFVFITTGAPQSERLAHRLSREGDITGIGLCVGGSLLFVTGLTTRASPLVRRLGLEWLDRLVRNPRKHFRRVFADSLPVVGLALRDWCRAFRLFQRHGPDR